MRSLNLESIAGSMPTFYSPHAEIRAKYLQGLLGGEIAYYADVFHVPLAAITLAVLDPHQWPIVAEAEPYGMPSVDSSDPAVFVMPVSWDEVKWMAVPKREDVPPALLKKALTGGRQWDEIKFEGCDGIGTHEIGHFIILQLGIEAPTKWFNEFLASYVGYAYLKAKAPAQAVSNEIFWTLGLENSPHRFTKLDDFENRYDELQETYPANYGWYQLALDQRVIQIYAANGVEYLRRIRTEFPSGGPKLDSRRLLIKLAKISPGWQTWATQVESGKLKAAIGP